MLNLTIEGLSSECAYDQLTARPVPAANNSEARLCGRLAGPTLLRAAANALRVEFRSDGSVQRAGFSADFFFDPDECALGSAGCSHACLNTLPGFRCSCPPALRLAADGRTCEAPDCAHQLNEPSGVLESAGFPAPYPARLHCHWHLITTPGHRVLLASARNAPDRPRTRRPSWPSTWSRTSRTAPGTRWPCTTAARRRPR